MTRLSAHDSVPGEALRKRRPVITDIHAGTDELPPHISIIVPSSRRVAQADDRSVQSSPGRCPRVSLPLISVLATPAAVPNPARAAGCDSALFLNDLRFRKHHCA